MDYRVILHARIWVAVIIVIFGCVLLAWGLCKPPEGEIHESVLIAFGEILTFAGVILGIDSNSRLKVENFKEEMKRHIEKIEKTKEKEKTYHEGD